MQPIQAKLSLFAILIVPLISCTGGNSSELGQGLTDGGMHIVDGGPSQIDSSSSAQIDASETPVSCGTLSEGRARCVGGPSIEYCENNVLVSTSCEPGATCGETNSTSFGVGCFCDYLSDGLCPEAEACSEDVDCYGATGIGSSIEECNGAGNVTLSTPGGDAQTWNVSTVWVYGSDPVIGTATTIFGYARPTIEHKTLPLVGTANEIQIRIAIPAPPTILVPGVNYAAIVALSEWDETSQSWSALAESTTNAVTLSFFETDQAAFENGSWCAGIMGGVMQGLVVGGGNQTIDMVFHAPFITPAFPE